MSWKNKMKHVLQYKESCVISETNFRPFTSLNCKLVPLELKILNYDEIRSFDWIKLIYSHRLVYIG